MFPQLLGLSVKEQLQGNVEKLIKDWKMTEKVIPGVIKRQPQVGRALYSSLGRFDACTA